MQFSLILRLVGLVQLVRDMVVRGSWLVIFVWTKDTAFHPSIVSARGGQCTKIFPLILRAMAFFLLHPQHIFTVNPDSLSKQFSKLLWTSISYGP